MCQVIETDDDFMPLDGGYDYLVDFMDLSFPDKRPERDHPYEEVTETRTEIAHAFKSHRYHATVSRMVARLLLRQTSLKINVFLDQKQSGGDETRGCDWATLG